MFTVERNGDSPVVVETDITLTNYRVEVGPQVYLEDALRRLVFDAGNPNWAPRPVGRYRITLEKIADAAVPPVPPHDVANR